MRFPFLLLPGAAPRCVLSPESVAETSRVPGHVCRCVSASVPAQQPMARRFTSLLASGLCSSASSAPAHASQVQCQHVILASGSAFRRSRRGQSPVYTEHRALFRGWLCEVRQPALQGLEAKVSEVADGGGVDCTRA